MSIKSTASIRAIFIKFTKNVWESISDLTIYKVQPNLSYFWAHFELQISRLLQKLCLDTLFYSLEMLEVPFCKAVQHLSHRFKQ